MQYNEQLYGLILDYQRERMKEAQRYRLTHAADQTEASAAGNKLPVQARLGLKLVAWGTWLQEKSDPYEFRETQRNPCTD